MPHKHTARLEATLARAEYALREAAMEADALQLDGVAYDCQAMQFHCRTVIRELLTTRDSKERLATALERLIL